MQKQIEDFISECLTGEAKEIALEFVAFLRGCQVEFYKDNGDCWKNKVYYWVKVRDRCVAFIAIKDPEEPENLWTVWSDDCGAFADDISEEDIKQIAWRHIDFCGHCGSCGGGRRKIVFGRKFEGVCGCTFRVDNPTARELPFLKKIVEICRNDALRNNE